VADRSFGADPVLRCWRRFRQFAEEQLVARGEASKIRAAQLALLRRTRKPTSWPCGIAPASGRPYDWFTIELANLRTAYPLGPPTTAIWIVAAPIATYAGWARRCGSKTREPIAWAEELIEPARRGRPPPGWRSCM